MMAIITDPSSFQYPTLQQYEIRLLELDPNCESSLAGRLHSAALPGPSEPSDAPSGLSAFDALSFCWINHEDEIGQHEKILLNGTGSISITLNLARALRRLIRLQKRTLSIDYYGSIRSASTRKMTARRPSR